MCNEILPYFLSYFVTVSPYILKSANYDAVSKKDLLQIAIAFPACSQVGSSRSLLVKLSLLQE